MAAEGIPPLLTIQYKGTAGTASVYRLIGGTTLIPVGPTLGFAFETDANYGSHAHARVIKFKDTVVATHQRHIWQLDEGANPTEADDTWTLVHTFTSANTQSTYSRKSGIHKVNIGGVPTLAIIYQDTTGHLRMSSSTDGTNWTDTGVLSPSALGTTILHGKSIVHNNKIYWAVSDASREIVELNPEIPTINYYNVTSWATAHNSVDFCTFDSRLWAIGWRSGSANVQPNLTEFTGGVWVDRGSFLDGGGGLDNSGSNHTQSGMCLFTDGTNMYALIPADDQSDNPGTFCFQMSLSAGPGSTLTKLDITNLVIPFGLRPPVAGPYFDDFRWVVWQDNHNDPSNPCVHLWVLDTDQIGLGTWTYYPWNGPGTLIGTPPGTGQISAAAGLAFPHTSHGGGERVWSSGQVNVEIISIDAADSGEEIEFKVWGDDGQKYRVRFFYDEADEVASSSATLRQSSIQGGTATFGQDSVGDYVDQVDGDGITSYRVIWETVEDGLDKDEIVTLMPSVEEI
jgi:hypothetical protein